MTCEANLGALGEAAIRTRRIMDAATARGEACPFCREVAP